MSPMQRIAEAVRRVQSVQDVNIVTTVENIPDTPVNDQWDDSIEVTLELNPPMDNRIPSNINPSLHERENTSGDPIVVVEHVPLLNGGPSISQQDVVDPIPTTGTITSTMAPAEPILTETVSIPSTPPDTLTGMTERVPLTESICLTAEDPQIRCTVCNTINCMIHNPRHRYCMDCGQRLLGPHICSNQIECTTVAIPQNTVGTDERRPIGTENNNPGVLLPRHYEPNTDVLEDRVTGNNPLIPREMVTNKCLPPQLLLKCVIMICLLMKKQSPRVQKYLSIQDLYPVNKIYYIAMTTAVILTKLEYILKFCPQPDPQEVDIEMLISEEKDGDIHPLCMITFTVTKSR